MPSSKHDIIRQLQQDILPLQGYRPPVQGQSPAFGLAPVEASFPNKCFPTGCIHEFLAMNVEQAAATAGFTAAVTGTLMDKSGVCIWIGRKIEVFPRALAEFGIGPERVIFITPKTDLHAAWAMEEALKCEGLAAVVGHIRDIDFMTSRRLQLAVEKSRVTGLILRHQPRQANPIAAVARWQVSPLQSLLEDDLPGVGFPRWQVELLKVRNGRPGKWTLEWSSRGFKILNEPEQMETKEQKRKIV